MSHGPSLRADWGAQDRLREPRLFCARRHDSYYLRHCLMMALLLSPLVVFAPGYFIAGLAGVVVSALLNRRVFFFELSGAAILYKPGFFSPALRIPYALVAEIGVWPEPFAGLTPDAPPMGMLLLRLSDGGLLAAPGLIDAEGTATAIRRLKAAETA